VWSVNPANNSVSVIRTDTNTLITNIPVGKEPQGVAVDPNNYYAFVASAADSAVTVIQILNPNPAAFQYRVLGYFTTGAEPWNIVSSPDGNRIFVANSSQDTITVIDAKQLRIIGDVDLRNSLCNYRDSNRHFQPRGLAVTQDSTKLYVTRFLSFVDAANGVQGVDTGKTGLVCRLDINTSSSEITDYRPAWFTFLGPRDTGFQFQNQEALAFPNQLQSIVIHGNQAYLPNVAASPSDPLQFTVDTEAFVNIIDNVNGGAQTDASQELFFLGSSGLGPNLNLGARTPEAGKQKLFFANPWGIAFTNPYANGWYGGYIISAASDLLVKVYIAPNGTLNFTDGPMTTRFIDLNDPTNPATSGFNAGKNPRGIVINTATWTAYVANFVSRNVSVVNLITDTVSKVIQTTALPTPGTDPEVVLVGAEQFFSSRGHYNQPAGTTISVNNRLAQVGWQACASCHFNGFTDGVVWTFNTGPRKSIPLNGTFDPQARSLTTSAQRVLNYSAIFDEVHDFDLNVRNVSGPGNLATAQPCSAPTPTVTTSLFDPNHGLLLGDTNAQEAPCTINAFLKPNEGRNEITVTLPGSTVAVKALSALNEWVRVAIRTPNGPLTDQQIPGGISSSGVASGRLWFQAAGCATCHGGDQWTSSIRNFTPPPAASAIFCATNTGTGSPPGCLTAAVTGNPVTAQFLASFLRDIKSFNLNVAGSTGTGNVIPGEPQIGAIEKATRTVVNGVLQAAPQDALGFDYNNDGKGSGFSPPSLLGINGFPPYYHNGACETLACVLADKNHRTAGNATDILANPADQALVVLFLESLDANTKPF